MQPPPGFTTTLPKNSSDYFDANYVAVRFDAPDVRAPLALGGLQRIATFPGDWAWCSIADLLAMLATNQASSSDASLQAKVDALEAELKALRGGLMIVYGEVSRLVGEVGQ